MSSNVTVGVAGATGALGGEILAVLDGVQWRPDRVVAFARASTQQSHVAFGDEQIPVDNLQDASGADVDVLLSAVPGEAGTEACFEAIRSGAAAVDCSGSIAEAPRVVPWINPEVLQALAVPLLSVPSAEATLLASVLGPLRRVGIDADVDATVLCSAATHGRRGVEELSGQVVAMFNSAPPPRAVFADGQAFDLVPADGPLDEAGWSEPERAIRDDVVALGAAEAERLTLTRIGVPTFSGIGATATVRMSAPLTQEQVTRVLKEGGVRTEEPRGSRTRAVEGMPFAHAGRIRLSDGGHTLRLWLAMDNLKTMATAAVASAGALLKPKLQEH